VGGTEDETEGTRPGHLENQGGGTGEKEQEEYQ